MTVGGIAHTRHVYATLDLIRGLLCLLVVLWHAAIALGIDTVSHTLPFAVDVFFVLSGFVVAHAYLGKLETGMGVGTFVLIRLIRFYPLLLLGLLLGTLLFVAQRLVGDGGGLSVGDVLNLAPQFAFLPVAPSFSDVLFPLNGPAWSLFAEMLINIVFALTWRWASIRNLMIVTLLGGVGVVAVTLMSGGQETGYSWSTFHGLAARVVFGFTAGVLLYRLHREGRPSPTLPGWLVLLSLGGAFLVIVPEAITPYWHALFVIAVCPGIVWLGVAAPLGRLGMRASSFFGGLSFAIYALHYPILGLIIGADAKTTALMPAHPWLAVGFLVVVAVFAAWGADALWDKPVTRWLRGRFLRPSGQARSA
jgi:peptidoglycan/LPS O-acetylase OafA/YrhL